MRLADQLALSTRMFTTRPMRTFLTILGVGIGIGAVLFLVGLGYGLQRVILNQITTADALLSLDVGAGASTAIPLDEQRVQEIAAIPGVTDVAREVSLTAQIEWGDLVGDVRVHAVDPAVFRLSGIEADHGDLFYDSTEPHAVLSSAAVSLFGRSADEMLEERVTLTLFVPKTDSDGFAEVEMYPVPVIFHVGGVIHDDRTSFAYVPLTAVALPGPAAFDLVKVKLADESVSESVREHIIGTGLVVSSLTDVIDQAKQIFRVLQIVLGLFGFVALVVSAIGMFNTMTIALLERTNEIGIMRSVGVTRGDIRMLFLVESMLMGVLGGIGGIGIGVLSGEVANAGLNLIASRLGGQPVDVFMYPAWFILVILGFSTLIGLLTGIFPARRAARMDPLEALRYK